MPNKSDAVYTTFDNLIVEYDVPDKLSKLDELPVKIFKGLKKIDELKAAELQLNDQITATKINAQGLAHAVCEDRKAKGEGPNNAGVRAIEEKAVLAKDKTYQQLMNALSATVNERKECEHYLYFARKRMSAVIAQLGTINVLLQAQLSRR